MVESARTASVCIEPASGVVDLGEQTIAAGEPSGRRFERICSPLRADLYRFAVWLTRDRALADNVVQEALLRGRGCSRSCVAKRPAPMIESAIRHRTSTS